MTTQRWTPTFFRKAEPSDGNDLARFEWKVAPEKIAAGECLVIGDEGGIRGYAIFNRSFFYKSWIAIMLVEQSHRRRGVGAAMIREIEKLCPGEKLFISTGLPNVAMQGLLSKLGFQMTGVIENLAEDPELVYFKLVKPLA